LPLDLFPIVPANKTGSISQAEFVISAVSARDFPCETLPEIVFAGRSNVGKSSLINALTGSRNLARTSASPGKTRMINFYRLGHALFFVDLPGFGYAKVAKAESRKWKQLVSEYFENRPAIALVVHLVDSRMDPTELDLQLARWLDSLGMPRLIVATKSDKLSGNARASQQRAISEAFGGEPVVLSSAVTGAGSKEIWNRVADAAQSADPRKKSPKN
jgi:GTP-binding protein